MGIEGFYKALEKRANKYGIQTNYNNKTDTNFFYIDFNSMIYHIGAKIDEEIGLILAGTIYNDLANPAIIELAKKWNYDINESNLELYKSFFTEERLNNVAIEMVKENIINFLETYTDSKYLEKLFISIDGVPNFGKLIEQKQRKYLSYVREKIIDYIYNENKKNLSKERIQFEESRVRFKRSNIVTWSPFMKRVQESFDNEWINEIKKIRPALKELIVSGCEYPGEGEKKIMEDILLNIQQKRDKIPIREAERNESTRVGSGNYMFYSPDADAILLTIIMRNINYIQNHVLSDKFYVLHPNDDGSFSLIDTNEMVSYICNYVTRLHDIHIDLTDDLICDISNDFVLLCNVFGNDFVPKIESINVKTDLTTILDMYKNMFNNDGKLNKIIQSPKNIMNQFTINYDNLIRYLTNLGNIEDNLIRQKYITNNYDTRRIKELLDNKYASDRLIYRFVSDYMKELTIFLNSLVSNRNNVKKFIIQFDEDFIERFVILENINKYDGDLYFVAQQISNDLLNEIDNKQIPIAMSALYKQESIEEALDFPEEKYLSDPVNEYIYKRNNEKFTQYDINVMELEWKLGEYETILNASTREEDYENQFGVTEINLINNKFVFNVPKVNRDYYYKSYVHDKHSTINEYIFGFLWTFDFYFNKNDKKYNYDNVSTWFYTKHRAPLVRELVQNMRNLTNQTNIQNYLVKREIFINRYEQQLYVVPKEQIRPILPSYESVFSNNRLFPDLDKYTEKIWNDRSGKYIDCRRMTFFAKCILKQITNLTFDEFYDLVKYGRNSDVTRDYGNSENELQIIFNKNEQIGSGNYYKSSLEYYRNTYKKLYLETRNKKYKNIYKTAKKLILHRIETKNGCSNNIWS